MRRAVVIALVGVLAALQSSAYPLDGYETTDIHRLEAYFRAQDALLARGSLQPGSLRSVDDVQLRLADRPDFQIPAPDPEFTAKIRSFLGEDAAGYGIAKDRFDGHDVLHVRERIGEAVARARAGEGPTLIEILTYRFRGHSMSDPGRYRTSEEVEERKQNHDPVRLARAQLLEAGVPEEELAALDAEVEEETQDAVRFADESAPASAETMWDSVYAPSLATSEELS